MPPRSRKPPITITGLDELKAAFKQLMGSMSDKELQPIMVEGAKVIKTAVKRRAKKLTGRLKKAVKAKKSRRKKQHSPSAFCAIDRKIAPHSHLVEDGHALVVNGQVVGNVPAQPFFGPGVRESMGQAEAVVIKGMARGIDAVKRKRGGRKK